MTRAGALKVNILNDITATASFIFNYSLLFQLFKYLDATVENGKFHLNCFAIFDNEYYVLSNWLRWYEEIFFEGS